MSEVKTEAKPITLTHGAVKQLQRIKAEQNIPEHYGLRIGVKGGGCSGFSYMLGFDDSKDNDSTYEIEGIKVYMQKSHAIYLLGMEIDGLDVLQNRGFAFKNPNSK